MMAHKFIFKSDYRSATAYLVWSWLRILSQGLPFSRCPNRYCLQFAPDPVSLVCCTGNTRQYAFSGSNRYSPINRKFPDFLPFLDVFFFFIMKSEPLGATWKNDNCRPLIHFQYYSQLPLFYTPNPPIGRQFWCECGSSEFTRTQNSQSNLFQSSIQFDWVSSN